MFASQRVKRQTSKHREPFNLKLTSICRVIFTAIQDFPKILGEGTNQSSFSTSSSVKSGNHNFA